MPPSQTIHSPMGTFSEVPILAFQAVDRQSEAEPHPVPDYIGMTPIDEILLIIAKKGIPIFPVLL